MAMRRQFIEAAARVMWAGAWGEYEESKCRYCGVDLEAARGTECTIRHPDRPLGDFAHRGRSRSGKELTDAAPPTPDYARLEAAILLGKLEQANGCGLAAIVHSAREVDSCPRREDGAHVGCPGISVAEFASAVALEALGTGVSWTDDHEAFTLPGGDRCEHCGMGAEFIGHRIGSEECKRNRGCEAPRDHHPFSGRKPFVVPSIEFTYEEGEE